MDPNRRPSRPPRSGPSRSRPPSRTLSKTRSIFPPSSKDCTVTLPVEIDVSVKIRSHCKPWGSSRTRGGMIAEELLQSIEETDTEKTIAPRISMQQIFVLQKVIARQKHIVSALTEINFPTRIKSLCKIENKIMKNAPHNHNGDKQKQQQEEIVRSNRNNFPLENYKNNNEQVKTIGTGAIKKLNSRKKERSFSEQCVEDNTFKSQLLSSIVSDIELLKINYNDDANENESVHEKTKSENRMN